MNAIDTLERQLDSWGLTVCQSGLSGLTRYAHLLSSYEKANIIGTREIRKIILEHLLDSLSCFLFRPLAEAGCIADVGSGGGLPGLPLKIVRRELSITLVEATGKKAHFLRQVTEDLSLSELRIENSRVEDIARNVGHRENYDVVTARAVARLSVVAEYCVPLLRVGGHAISMKGRLESEELDEGRRAAEILGARVAEVIQVPFLPEVPQKERRLVIIEKVRRTPARYPRKSGTATRNPLGMQMEKKI